MPIMARVASLKRIPHLKFPNDLTTAVSPMGPLIGPDDDRSTFDEGWSFQEDLVTHQFPSATTWIVDGSLWRDPESHDERRAVAEPVAVGPAEILGINRAAQRLDPAACAFAEEQTLDSFVLRAVDLVSGVTQ